MKTVYIYGHHGIEIGTMPYNDFSELPILFNKGYSNFTYFNEFPNDDLITRNMHFKQYCILKYKSAGRFKYHKLMLMNDEVSFLYATGSYKCIRFNNMKEAKDFYEYLCKKSNIINYKISNYNTNSKFNIGYEFELLEDFENYTTGKTYRIYDSGKAGEGLLESNYEWVCPSPIIGETMCKIPNTKWSYIWNGYCQIPVDIIKITNTKTLNMFDSNESLF